MTDYSVFASPDFDANDYANAILAGEPYPHQQPGKVRPSTLAKPSGLESAKEDISIAISKLNLGIDDVSKQIKQAVTLHHEELLQQAAESNNLSGSLSSVRQRLDDLDVSLDKLRLKIRVPYQSLSIEVNHLQQLQQASDVLRRTSRFVILARRLEAQMSELGDDPSSEPNVKRVEGPSPAHRTATEDPEDEKERSVAKAARSIAELVTLLDEPTGVKVSQSVDAAGSKMLNPVLHDSINLRSINAVACHVPFIEEARVRVTTTMESMVESGLNSLNQSLLASSLQTAYSLGLLPNLVQSLVQQLSSAVEEQIRAALDLTQISKEALAREPQQVQSSQVYRSRIRTEPTSVTAPQWIASLWSRLTNLIEGMSSCCIKVHTLEKVLKLKKDTVTQTVFLDEAMKVMESKPSASFWTALALSLEKHVKDASKNSMFLQQSLSAGYPRLLRLFHQFFASIGVHTDTVYTQAHQSPETVLVLRALSTLETLYLSRSSTKLNEAVAQATRNSSSPGLETGVNIARVVVNELDSAKFDPLLARNVAKTAATSLTGLVGRVEGLVARDRSATSLIGPSATQSQVSNAQLATCLYHCLSHLEKLEAEYPSDYKLLRPSIDGLRRIYHSILDPLSTAIRRELGAIIARLHRVDFGRSVDPMASMGGGPSLYMKDLVDKLAILKSEILDKFNIGGDGRSWVMSIVTFVIRIFVLHVSIAKPLGENGKLQLTSDMTELEFALSAFLVEGPQSKRGGNLDSVGDDYRTLRAMRPLLFLDNAQLAVPSFTQGLPTLIVLHHILVRSPVPLPHSLHGWQEAEYVRWVDEHSEEEAWALVESGLVHWEKMLEAEAKDPREGNASDYVQLARTALASARKKA